MDSSDLSDGAVTLQEYLELKKALAASEAKVQQLLKVNSSLSDELRRLQREVRAAALARVGASSIRAGEGPLLPEVGVLPGASGGSETSVRSQIHKLQAENLQIRQPPGPVPTPPPPSERAEPTSMGPGGSAHRRDRQAFSMYEPGSALKPFGGPPGDELTTRLQPFHSTVSCPWVSRTGGDQGLELPWALPDACCAIPQELEDDAIYSVHVPAGLYRVSRAWGKWAHVCTSVLSPSGCQLLCWLLGTEMTLAAGKLEGGWQGGKTDSSSPGFQIRKGVSASAVPFTPSSPLLSCSQEGSRHTVTFPSPVSKGHAERDVCVESDGLCGSVDVHVTYCPLPVPPEQAFPPR